jgi:lysophospholipid acyltransferase (LPLAT)-like uncharacterized protein
VSATPTPTATAESVGSAHFFTFRQRLALWFITWAGYLAIRLIGPTLRFSVSLEEGDPPRLGAPPLIYSFWHRCVFPAAYLWRDLQIRVMTSRSFDGEYIARIIRKFGFVPVRGSSSRGAIGAFLNMRRELEQGWNVAFTIDGPRGPRYVAKPGPVLLARASGAPVCAFHIAVENAWILQTWDAFMIPKPYSRALARVSRPIAVPADAGDAEMQRIHSELQSALDRVRDFAEANVSRAGSPEFPVFAK